MCLRFLAITNVNKVTVAIKRRQKRFNAIDESLLQRIIDLHVHFNILDSYTEAEKGHFLFKFIQ